MANIFARENYDQEESGTIDPSDYYIPFEIVNQIDSVTNPLFFTTYYTALYHGYWNGSEFIYASLDPSDITGGTQSDFKFEFLETTSFISLAIGVTSGIGLSVLLVSPTGEELYLWDGTKINGVPSNEAIISQTPVIVDGNVYTEYIHNWRFNSFDAAYFVIGRGGLGYTDEGATVITSMRTNIDYSNFWTNHVGQEENI